MRKHQIDHEKKILMCAHGFFGKMKTSQDTTFSCCQNEIFFFNINIEMYFEDLVLTVNHIQRKETTACIGGFELFS